MKPLIVLMAVGCGSPVPAWIPGPESYEEIQKATPSKTTENTNTTAKPRKDLTKEDVDGAYEPNGGWSLKD